MKEELYRIEQPNVGEQEATEVLSKVITFRGEEEFVPEFRQARMLMHTPKYLHWEHIKNKKPYLKGVEQKEFWALIKDERKAFSRKTHIRDVEGKYFTLHEKWPECEKFLYELTRDMSGNRLLEQNRLNQNESRKYILSGLMEEAIASSQLEGASTTRQRAKDMIRRGLKPRDKAERMILNNYRTMMMIDEEFKDQSLSLDMLLTMHEMLTSETLENEEDVGKLRSDDDKIVIEPRQDKPGMIIYRAPSMKFVEQELPRLIDFANGNLKEDTFRHPVINAIMLHFWMGLLHPFVDGNGRIARALFYWYMLREGYYAFAFSPLSAIIKKAPAQYWKAFVYAEQDDNDLTYFVDYHIRKLQEAQKQFIKYCEEKARVTKPVPVVMLHKYALNERQAEVLQYFYGGGQKRTDVTTHTNVFSVSRGTATTDLKTLEKKGFLVSQKVGLHVYYYPTNKINVIFDML